MTQVYVFSISWWTSLFRVWQAESAWIWRLFIISKGNGKATGDRSEPNLQEDTATSRQTSDDLQDRARRHPRDRSRGHDGNKRVPVSVQISAVELYDVKAINEKSVNERWAAAVIKPVTRSREECYKLIWKNGTQRERPFFR